MNLKRWNRRLLCLGVVPLMSAGLAGCGPTETAAEFQTGTDEQSLDGSTIENDGSTFEMSTDGEREVLSRIEIDGGDRYIEFDTDLSETLGVPVPSAIGTGNNTLEVNTSTGLATLTVDVPLQGQQTFTFQTGDALSLFGLESRAAMQQAAPSCERSVAAIDEFCELFETNAPEAIEEVVDLAVQFAAEAGLPDVANGFIEQVVTEFYDVLVDFCDAWTEVRDGSTEKNPVDPCDQ